MCILLCWLAAEGNIPVDLSRVAENRDEIHVRSKLITHGKHL
jgi:hypothetical protein